MAGRVFIARSRMKKAVLILSAFGFIAAAWGSVASPLPGESTSMPEVKPLGFIPETAIPESITTGAIPRNPAIAPVNGDLKAGLDALSDKDPQLALSIRDSMRDATLDRHILTRAIAVSGLKGVPSYEIASAAQELKGWPGLARLRAYSERALYDENPAPSAILAAFGDTAPETMQGAVILGRALIASGKQAQAAKYIRKVWRGEALDKATEDKILIEFSALLTPADHKARMDYLMYRGRVAQAKRFGDMGQAQSLYKAWLRSTPKRPMPELCSTESMRSGGPMPACCLRGSNICASRTNMPRRQHFWSKCRPSAANSSIPANGGTSNASSAVASSTRGQFKPAYRIVANYAATSPTDIVEAEFHAGWYALRGLQDPAAAERHFRKILETSNGPISVSRAWYWLGRAAEAGGPGKSSEFYAKAANFPGTFYGQLAAERLGRKTLNVTYPSPSTADRQRFQHAKPCRPLPGWRPQAMDGGPTFSISRLPINCRARVNWLSSRLRQSNPAIIIFRCRSARSLMDAASMSRRSPFRSA